MLFPVCVPFIPELETAYSVTHPCSNILNKTHLTRGMVAVSLQLLTTVRAYTILPSP